VRFAQLGIIDPAGAQAAEAEAGAHHDWVADFFGGF
jgi:hypothetical protein